MTKARSKPEPEAPQFWIAAEPLFVHDPESGVAPARAFNPGDRVPPDLVEAHGWRGKVRDPREPQPGQDSALSDTAPAPGAISGGSDDRKDSDRKE